MGKFYLCREINALRRPLFAVFRLLGSDTRAIGRMWMLLGVIASFSVVGSGY